MKEQKNNNLLDYQNPQGVVSKWVILEQVFGAMGLVGVVAECYWYFRIHWYPPRPREWIVLTGSAELLICGILLIIIGAIEYRKRRDLGIKGKKQLILCTIFGLIFINVAWVFPGILMTRVVE